LEDPLTINEEGINVKPELMTIDKLYHCVFKNSIFIFYKDEEGFMHCYEVNEPAVVKQIEKSPLDLEEILLNFSSKEIASPKYR
jgi:hypothetical protein